MTQIFISYRRNDSGGRASRLQADLEREFGEGTVFLDIDDITPGEKFDEHILERLKASDVVLAIIGRSWLPPTEYVSWEIAAAIAAGKRLIPVLVDGAHIPEAKDLPEEIRSLVRHHAIEISDRTWTADVARLVEVITGRKNRPGCALAVVAFVLALLGVAAWYWLQPRENVYLSKELEVPGNDFRMVDYRKFISANGTLYENGLVLASQHNAPSVLKYRIPRGMRTFRANVVSYSFTCEGYGDTWKVSVDVGGKTKTHHLSHHQLDPLPIELPVDSIPPGQPRVVSITVDPVGHDVCDLSALGDPHFSPAPLKQ